VVVVILRQAWSARGAFGGDVSMVVDVVVSSPSSNGTRGELRAAKKRTTIAGRSDHPPHVHSIDGRGGSRVSRCSPAHASRSRVGAENVARRPPVPVIAARKVASVTKWRMPSTARQRSSGVAGGPSRRANRRSGRSVSPEPTTRFPAGANPPSRVPTSREPPFAWLAVLAFAVCRLRRRRRRPLRAGAAAVPARPTEGRRARRLEEAQPVPHGPESDRDPRQRGPRRTVHVGDAVDFAGIGRRGATCIMDGPSTANPRARGRDGSTPRPPTTSAPDVSRSWWVGRSGSASRAWRIRVSPGTSAGES